jgi:uncharacterized protein YaaQ
MKLVVAILNKSDEKAVVGGMMRGGFFVTKLTGTGGFLRRGTSTLISAVNNERLENALEIIRGTAKGRKYAIDKVDASVRQIAREFFDTGEITVGGATVIVMDIEGFYKY